MARIGRLIPAFPLANHACDTVQRFNRALLQSFVGLQADITGDEECYGTSYQKEENNHADPCCLILGERQLSEFLCSAQEDQQNGGEHTEHHAERNACCVFLLDLQKFGGFLHGYGKKRSVGILDRNHFIPLRFQFILQQIVGADAEHFGKPNNSPHVRDGLRTLPFRNRLSAHAHLFGEVFL